ncbi:hypothetical protein TNCV_3894971, partial [Trichonephila clavipes]
RHRNGTAIANSILQSPMTLLLSRPTTPSSLPAESSTDCGKRRAAMIRLQNQETMIEGYRKFLATFKAEKMSMEFINNSETCKPSGVRLLHSERPAPSPLVPPPEVATPPLHPNHANNANHVSPDQGRRNLTRFQFP